MSSFSQSFSRRSLLRLGVGASAVAGSAALLSACGSGSSSQQSGSQGGSLSGSKSSANPNGYSDDGQNYSGLVEYTHYDGALNYEQGTVDHPPRNAPKPQVTDTLSLNTVTGFHEAIAYFAAAMDYLVKTGSADAFSTGPHRSRSRPLSLPSRRRMRWCLMRRPRAPLLLLPLRVRLLR